MLKRIITTGAFIALFCGLFVPSLLAQSVFHFTEGLVINRVNHYGREALYSDQLAWQLYSGVLKAPAEGNVFGQDRTGKEIKWERMTADTSGRFGKGYWGAGYLYLSYRSQQARTALLNITGNSAVFVNGALHFGDPYEGGWMYIPVQLKQGLNEFYVRGQYVKADLIFPAKPVMLNTQDPTLPSIVIGNDNSALKAAVVVINAGTKELTSLSIKSVVAGNEVNTRLPVVPGLSTRKVIFNLNAAKIKEPGKIKCKVVLMEGGKSADENEVTLEAVSASDKYANTFVSSIDGSLQYYAVAPQSGTGPKAGSALFFSVHGAGVEAIGQARAYQSKDWGTLVAPTNRRPRGFNWEDWGRLDALEVLAIAKQTFKPDPRYIYLTGHSMGGHGTWFLGATYPGNWAAIAPCSGYPTLKGYGSADGLIPDSSTSPSEQLLLRASNQSDVIKLATNYKPLGVYILHGDADSVVPVTYARQMKNVLAKFHPDFSYYEYPGGSHWFGSESVDWKPLFDYLKWHKRAADSAVNVVDFITSSPGISSVYRWISVLQQIYPMKYSRISVTRDKSAGTISGSAENIRLLKIKLGDFGSGKEISVILDSLPVVKYTTKGTNDSLFLVKDNDRWNITTEPPLSQKGPHRYGTFKEPFNKKMVFVYGTKGTAEENQWSLSKARYDAEAWYYRGNGAVDVIPDREYSKSSYEGRNVILYGNSATNSAWNVLLKDCPVQVSRNTVRVGNKMWTGDNLGAYFMWPVKNTASNTVAVISGSGIKGMNAATANQYFAGGSGFPDFMVFTLDMLTEGSKAVKAAGFYDMNWKLSGDMISNP